MTTFSHRAAVGVVQHRFCWHQLTDPTPVDRRLTWLRDTHTTLQTHLATSGYTNGMDPEPSTDLPPSSDGHGHPVETVRQGPGGQSLPVMTGRGVDSFSACFGRVWHWFGRSFPAVVGRCRCAGVDGTVARRRPGRGSDS